tara:strand:+ start:75 stop:1067 length:993 start_codon:yes stop_codon:yes gene_type:complete
MNFLERDLENNIASTKKDIREANDELLNAANSLAADVLKNRINALTLKLHKCLDDLKSINPNNSLLNAEDRSLVPDDYEEVLDSYLNELVALESTYLSENYDDFILEDDEEILFCVDNIVLSEEKTVKIQGTYQGLSIRIMSGVWYRVGQASGGTEVKIVPIDTGTFALTTKRIIFHGEKKSLSYNLETIVSVRAFEEGVGLGRSKKQKIEYFSNFDLYKLNNEESDMEYLFNGGFMKTLIMKVIKYDYKNMDMDMDNLSEGIKNLSNELENLTKTGQTLAEDGDPKIISEVAEDFKEATISMEELNKTLEETNQELEESLKLLNKINKT